MESSGKGPGLTFVPKLRKWSWRRPRRTQPVGQYSDCYLWEGQNKGRVHTRGCVSCKRTRGPYYKDRADKPPAPAFRGKSARKGTYIQGWAWKLLKERLSEPVCPSSHQAQGLWPHSCLLRIRRRRSNQMSSKAWKQFFFFTQIERAIADTE